MKEDANKESPPVFKSWNGWYALVFGTLIFLIAVFYAFTLTFR